MERENRAGLGESQLSDLYQIRPLIFEAKNIWKETGTVFQSIKARQEMLVEKFFPKNFVHRHVIPALDSESVYKTLSEVCFKKDVSVGIRTAFADSRLAGAPWIMQNSSDTPEVFLDKTFSTYNEWMRDKKGTGKPEALIIMENPKDLGESYLAKDCFVFRIALIPSESRCILEGCPWTDQTRDLEETLIVDGERIKNPHYDVNRNFHGALFFDTPSEKVVPNKLYWDDKYLERADTKTRVLLDQIKTHLFVQTDLSNLLARLITLKLTTHHETIQFQGRISSLQENKSYFDFLLGYGIRGAEELELGKQEIQNNYRESNSSRNCYSWQIPFYE